MRELGTIVPVTHTLSVLMMICMVATPDIFRFIISVLSQPHLSCLGVTVAILLLDGLALVVRGVVHSVLPVGLL